jgi:hypothetical protein
LIIRYGQSELLRDFFKPIRCCYRQIVLADVDFIRLSKKSSRICIEFEPIISDQIQVFFLSYIILKVLSFDCIFQNIFRIWIHEIKGGHNVIYVIENMEIQIRLLLINLRLIVVRSDSEIDRSDPRKTIINFESEIINIFFIGIALKCEFSTVKGDPIWKQRIIIS